MSKKINVVIICGGPSNEREISLKTGEQVLKALPAKYSPHLIEIKENGKWLLKASYSKKFITNRTGIKTLIPHQKQHFEIFDVVFIAMHGKFGEDGKIQALFETINIPYTGSGVLASALGMNKRRTLEVVGRYGIKTPKFIFLYSLPDSKNQFIKIKKLIAKQIGYPCVIKPNESGSSKGVSIVHNEREVRTGLEKASKEDRAILIEEYIKGLELTCAVMGNSGQTSLVALSPVEIISSNEFFDYDAKYFSKKTKEICPARISKKQTKQLKDISKKVHEIIGCDGLSRSDFILTSRGKLYFLEINTIPGLTETSLSPKEAIADGMTFPEFLEKQIELAILKNRNQHQ